MKRYGLITALLLLLAINGLVLGGVYYNRSGAPDAAVIMTERELPLAYSYRHKENSGVALSLNWNRQGWSWDWFDEAKVLELGFDRKDLDSEKKRYRYYNLLPIKAFVVLEYEGLAWQAYRQKQRDEITQLPEQVATGKMEEEAAERRRKELENSLVLSPRLFAIDVGLDPEVLRGSYPDRARYIILPAKVRVSASWQEQPGKSERVRKLSGRIDNILTEQIYVPKQYHSLLGALPSDERIYAGNRYYNSDSRQRVHYQARFNVGQRYEPWLAGIEELSVGE